MNKRLLNRLALALPLATCSLRTLAATRTADATPWPTRPVRLVVGFPGGSSPDLVARALAEAISPALGQPVLVENKVGAAGGIAADWVAKASDQHTLGLMINGNLTIAKLLNPAIPYDPARDFAPVSLLATAPLVLVGATSVGADSAADFLARARQAGPQWSYGSPGVGTVAHIGMELLKSRAGLQPVHVPYPGNPQVVNALIGGELQLALLPPALAMAQVRAGKLRAIGLSSAGRSSLVPELPSLAELGVRDFELEIWNALAAPRSQPTAHLASLSQLVSDTVRSPEMRQRLNQQGWNVVGSSAQGLALRIAADTRSLGAVIAQQGIRAQ